MERESAILNSDEKAEDDLTEAFDFDKLEERLQNQLEEELADMQFLEDEKEKIGNPENLGNVIMDVVWEQFLNQVAVTAGEDFIKENRNLHLDLSKDAHIQTTENFAKGKIATHNTEIDYTERHKNYQSNFEHDENGNVVTHITRSGKKEATLVKGARKPFDKERPRGSAKNHTDMDHTISAAEEMRDPAVNAHMTKEEQIAFANSDANLNEMDSSWNRSKGDKSMTDWLDQPNSKGQKPNEIFDMSAEDEEKLRQKDKEAREELERKKKEGEKKSIQAGKKSRREEAFRIGRKALRAAVMQLLAEFVREIIAKLVKWFKTTKKSLDTLLDNLKEAIHAFVGKLQTHLISTGDMVVSTVVTAIIGPVFGTIKKVWIMLKQGWSSLKNAIDYIKDPANKGKPISILLMEVGKIIIAGLTGAGSLILGDVIEKGLMVIPVFAIEIPLLGSLANILGIFLGAVVAGIIGAIAINFLEKLIAKKKEKELQEVIIKKGNKVIAKQHQIQIVNEALLERDKENVQSNISGRRQEAASIMKDAYENIMEDFVENFSENVDISAINEEDVITSKKINEIGNDLDDLLNGLE